MRLSLVVGLLVMFVTAPAVAKTQVTAQAHGLDGEIDFFVPEIVRSMQLAIAKAPIDFGSGDTTIAVVLDELANGRGRLSVVVRGHNYEQEGKLGELDNLVIDVVTRMRSDETLNRQKSPGGAIARKGSSATPTSTPTATPTPTPTPTLPTTIAPTPTLPVREPEPPPDLKAEEKKPTEEKKPVDEPKPPVDKPPVDKPDPKPAETPGSGMVHGRVVAHAITDLPSSYPMTGSLATQALYFFLSRRLHLTVVPTGLGIATVSTVADEAWRAGAPIAVMSRLLSANVTPLGEGVPPDVRVRLEVIIVRDGHEVMRRVFDSPPSTGVGALVRGRPVDPLYLAVLGALEAGANELGIALH